MGKMIYLDNAARSQMHLAPRKKKSISQLAAQSLITGP